MAEGQGTGFLSKQCDVMRIFLLQFLCGTRSWGTGAYLCLFYFFMLYPNFWDCFLFAALQEGGNTSGGFSCLIHMQDSESLTGFFSWIGLEVHCWWQSTNTPPFFYTQSASRRCSVAAGEAAECRGRGIRAPDQRFGSTFLPEKIVFFFFFFLHLG